jgi:muramoyltetrapeptide carboxypeptidase
MSWSPMYPAPLRAGDRILVTAPSAGVSPALHPRLDVVLNHLRAQGYEVEEGRCLREDRKNESASAEQRAEEFQGALLRPDVRAVLPPWGGERAMDLLHRVDWDALREHPPKWFAGFSDLSTLMLPLLLRSGWATVHGANLMELSPSQTDPLYQASMTTLARRPLERWEHPQSAHHLTERNDWAEAPESAYGLQTPTHW